MRGVAGWTSSGPRASLWASSRRKGGSMFSRLEAMTAEAGGTLPPPPDAARGNRSPRAHLRDRGRGGAASASRARGRTDGREGMRHEAGDDEALLRDGVPVPIELTKEFTRQYPNVKWKIRQDQFAVHHAERAARPVGAEPARPDAAAAGQRAGQGRPAEEPRRLLQGSTGGTGSRPRSSRSCGCRAGRPPARQRLAVGDGPQLQPDRRLLQQDARGEDRDDERRRRRSPSSTRCWRRRRPPGSRRSCSSTAARPAACSSRCSS